MSDASLRETVHGGLNLAQFAELSALARLSSASFQEALAERELSEDGWNAARDAWNGAIEDGLERGDDGLVVAFAEALAEAKERLRRTPPEPPSSRRGRASTASTPAPMPLPTATQVSPPELLSITDAPPNPAFVPVSANVPASAHVPPILSAEAEKPRLDITAKLPLQGIIARILPFQPASAASQLASPTSPGASASAPAAATSPHPAAPSGAGPAEPAKLKPVSSSLGGTAELVMPRVLPKPLPFASPSATAPQASASSQGSASSTAPPPQPSAAAPSPSSPPGAAAASTPRLTPEQYASLTAELAVRPHRAAEVRARYFVATEAAWDALQAEWRQHMDADPRLKQRITELVAHYRTWLERSGGGSKER